MKSAVRRAHLACYRPCFAGQGERLARGRFHQGRLRRNHHVPEWPRPPEPGVGGNCRQETRDWAKAIEADERSKASAPPEEAPSFGRRYDLFTIVGNGRYSSVLRMSATEIDDVYNAIENTTLLWDSKEEKRIDLSRFFGESGDGGPAMTRLFAEATEGLVGQVGKDRAAELIGTLRPVARRDRPDFADAVHHRRQELGARLSLCRSRARAISSKPCRRVRPMDEI